MDPTHRAKISAALKKLWADPARRERIMSRFAAVLSHHSPFGVSLSWSATSQAAPLKKSAANAA